MPLLLNAWRVMRITALLLTVFCVQLSARTVSQTITWSGRDVPLEKVFPVIEQQTGYVVVYNKDVVQNAKPVTIAAEDLLLETFLEKMLHDQGLDYTIEGNTISIKKLSQAESPTRSLSVSLSPNIDVIGNVTSASGEFLSGVNIIIKRTSKGVTTNAKGNFVLKNVQSDDILIVSMIGYKTQNIPVAGKADFAIVMQVDADGLDKVVIQGYGKTSERLRTGNISTVSAKEIEKQPVVNVLQAIQGRVPGLVITQKNGYASAPFKVEIRGRNTIDNKALSDPLYIIDGVPLTVLEISGGATYASGSPGFNQMDVGSPAGGQSPFFSINPADIETVSVLKDADATAIYGSRGANGVILITTKKGTLGKTKLDVNIYHGISEVTKRWRMLNTKEYVEMRREAFSNDGITPNSGNAYDFLVWDTTRFVDWQDYLWGGMGKTTDAQMSISGGTNLTTYRLGGGYHHENTILTATGADQRLSVNLNLRQRSSNEKLLMDLATIFSYTSSNMISLAGTARLPPNAPAIYNEHGELNFRGWSPNSNAFAFGSLIAPYEATSSFLNTNLSTTYSILKELSFSTDIGYSMYYSNQNKIEPIVSQNPDNNPSGSSGFADNYSKNWIIEPHFEFNKRFGPGNLDFLLGGTLQGVSGNGKTVYGYGYSNDKLLYSISNALTTSASDASGAYRYAAVYSRVTYDIDKKYILNLTARRDGSSKFGEHNLYANFKSVGCAWIFSEEKIIKDHLKVLSFGKIRASYGTTGNDQIGQYQYLTRWSANGIAPYSNIAAYVPLQHANPNYQWQENKKFEAAINLVFLNEKFSIEVVKYQNRCGNQLIQYPLPILTGFSYVTANFPASVQNTGWEFVLNAKLLESQKFRWNLKFNSSINRNKLLSFPNILQSPYAYQLFVGEPLTLLRLLHYTGVNSETGTYSVEDKNKDGEISLDRGPNDDLYNITLNPKFTGGFGTDITIGNFQISAFFYCKIQKGVNALSGAQLPGRILINQPEEILNRWRKPGDKTEYPKFTTKSDITFNYFNSSDGVYTNASYLRLSNLHFSYRLPESLCKNIYINSCTLYFQGQNVFVITGYKGIDPETQNFGGMPPTKVFTAGIQITL